MKIKEKTDPSGLCSSFYFAVGVRCSRVDCTSYCRIYHFWLTKAINPIIDTFCYSYSRGASVSALELSTGYATFLFASRNYMHDQSSFNVLAFYALPGCAYRYPNPNTWWRTTKYKQNRPPEFFYTGQKVTTTSYLSLTYDSYQSNHNLYVLSTLTINHRHLPTFKQRITRRYHHDFFHFPPKHPSSPKPQLM